MGTEIVPDPEVGDPLDGGIKRVPSLAIGNEVGLGVGDPPGYGGGCIPLASGHKDSPPLAIANELGLGVGLPPGDGGGCTPSVSGLRAGLDVPSVTIKGRPNEALRPTATGSLSRDGSPPSQAAEADKSENYSSTYEKNLYAFFSFTSAFSRSLNAGSLLFLPA